MNAPISEFTQTGRLLTVSTALGADALLLEKLEVHESMNALFTMRASVRAKSDTIAAADIVGGPLDATLSLGDNVTRAWNGLVTGLDEGPNLALGRHYVLTVRPRLWLMTQRSDCRIFQDKTSTDIVEQLCKEHGITDLDIRVIRKPAPQHYSIQWNETDLAYLTRRLDEDGLFYWFEHKPGHHTLVVADHQSGYRESPEATVRLAFGSSDRAHINAWRRSFVFSPGKRASKDWNFETPLSPPAGQVPSTVKLPGNAAYELYHYPGRFADPMQGEAAQRLRMQATEADFERLGGSSGVRTLAPGFTFTPQEVPRPDAPHEAQVITSITHTAVDPTYEANAGAPAYENSFEVIPARVPATPHRATPRPRIDGLQIAVVAGPSGEEIHTDQYGRIKLKFPWDRRAVGDGSDTMWIRVAQTWAGGTWGAQIIPRVGMEVLVAFQEGDPDRPIVVGVVPNPVNSTPYDLPANKTRMTLRSNSYKSKGFNEITFEDATSGENLFVHAQKDHTQKIENNQTNSVGANHSNSVGQNQALTVGANQTQEIGGSANLTVGGTGSGAMALMAPLTGMAGETAGLLGDALNVAGGGASSSGGPGAGGAISSGSGGSLIGMAMGAVGAAGGGLGGITGTMMPQLASSLIGMLGGSGQQAQQNVGNGPSPRPDAGTALASAGAALGQAAGSLFSMGGILNTTVGLMRTDSIGMAHAMQIGTSQAINIGSTKNEKIGKASALAIGEQYNIDVGKTMTINVGEILVITVGKSKLVMDKEGNVSLSGKKFVYSFSDHIQAFSKLIDLN